MTRPRVTLILPPAGDPRAPHLSLPALTGFLRARGVEVQQIDADLEALLHLLDQPRLEERLTIVRRNRHAFPTAEEFRRRYALWELAVENITRAISCLKSADSFYDPAAFHSARNTIDLALNLVCNADAPRLSYSLSPLVFDYEGYDLRQCSQLVELCERDENFPFSEYVTRDLVGKLEAFGPDIVGISILNYQQLAAGLYIAKTLRRRGYHTVIGGTVFSKFRSEILNTPGLFEHFTDWLVLYEGETALIKLIESQMCGRDLERVPNLAYLKRGRPAFTHTHVEDVRFLPTPDFEGLPLGEYLTPEPVLPIYFGKGCYFNLCKFCDIPHINSISEKAYRVRSVEQVCDDLAKLHAATKATNFVVTDEAVSPAYCDRLADELTGRRQSDYNFTAYARLERRFTAELCRKMAGAGFRKLYFGLESGSQAAVDHMNKKIDVLGVPNVLRGLNEAGMRYHIFAMIGLPEETEAQARETFNFFKKNRPVIEVPGNTFEIHRFGLDLRTEYFNARQKYGVRVRPAALKGDFIFGMRDDEWDNLNGMSQSRVDELLDEFYDRLRDVYARWHNYPGSFWPMSEEYSLLYCVRYRNLDFPFLTSPHAAGGPNKTVWATVGWDVLIEDLDGEIVLENIHARARVNNSVARLVIGAAAREGGSNKANLAACSKAAVQQLISNGLLAIRMAPPQVRDSGVPTGGDHQAAKLAL